MPKWTLVNPMASYCKRNDGGAIVLHTLHRTLTLYLVLKISQISLTILNVKLSHVYDRD